MDIINEWMCKFGDIILGEEINDEMNKRFNMKQQGKHLHLHQ